MAGYLRIEKRRNVIAEITVLPSGRVVPAAGGSSILDALLAAGENLTHRCAAGELCGDCHVIVRRGCRSLSKVRREELQRLARIEGAQALSRLACQAALGTRDITVQLISH